MTIRSGVDAKSSVPVSAVTESASCNARPNVTIADVAAKKTRAVITDRIQLSLYRPGACDSLGPEARRI